MTSNAPVTTVCAWADTFTRLITFCSAPSRNTPANTPPNVPRPGWLYYFAVDNIDAAVTRITSNGGNITMGGGAGISRCRYQALRPLLTVNGAFSINHRPILPAPW